MDNDTKRPGETPAAGGATNGVANEPPRFDPDDDGLSDWDEDGLSDAFVAPVGTWQAIDIECDHPPSRFELLEGLLGDELIDDGERVCLGDEVELQFGLDPFPRDEPNETTGDRPTSTS